MKLRDLVHGIEAGRSLACEPRRAGDDEWAVIKVSAMTTGVFRPEEAKPLPGNVTPDPRHEIRAGDLLISRANTNAYVGASVLVPNIRRRLLLSDKSLRLLPREHVDPRWLHLMLNAPQIREAISARASGTKDSMRNVTQRDLLDLELPDSPLDEQHRIVSALDDHLSRLDAGTQYLRAGRRRTEVAKQALIDQLFLDVARNLDWPVEPLEAFATTSRAITDGPFGSNLTSAHYTASGALVVRLQNIGDGEFKDAEAFVSLDHYEKLKAHDVRLGDVVVASLGDKLPRAAVVPDLRAPAIVKADCIRVRPDPDVDPRWLVYACRSRLAKRHAAELLKGVGRQRLGLKGIKSVPVPRVPLAEQQERLAELEEDLSALGRTTAQARRAMGQAEGLRRAVLSAAFGGHL